MDDRQERTKIKVLIRDQDWDDVMGQGKYNWIEPESEDVEGQGVRFGGLGETEDDAQGQVYILNRPKPGDVPDDTQGQGARGSWIRLEDPDDTEGQGYRGNFLVPASADDVEGQGYRVGYLVPDETDDAEGTGLKWRLEPDDVEGQGYKYG